MKKFIITLMVLLTVSSSVWARPFSQAYDVYNGRDHVASVFVTRPDRSKATKTYWVVFDPQGLISIAPLPSPYPDPDKRVNPIGIAPLPSPYPNPEKMDLERVNVNYRSIADFMDDLEIDTETQVFEITSIEIAPLPSP